MNLRSAVITLGNHFPSSLVARLGAQSWAARCVRALANRLLPRDPTMVTLSSGHVEGIRLFILPRSEKFLWTGHHEPEVQEVLANLLGRGMTFWDIGAHVGYFSLLASRLVGPTGTVHAFEPVPQTFARLEESITANQVQNVAAHQVALSTRTGTTSLHGGDVSVLWSLRPGNGTTTITVRCQTLADAFSHYGVPDLIKVDAEGAEIDILISGSAELLIYRVPVLLEAASEADVNVAQKVLPTFGVDRVNVNHWLLTFRSQ